MIRNQDLDKRSVVLRKLAADERRRERIKIPISIFQLTLSDRIINSVGMDSLFYRDSSCLVWVETLHAHKCMMQVAQCMLCDVMPCVVAVVRCSK